MPRPKFVPSLSDGVLAFRTADRAGRDVFLRWTENIDTRNRGWIVHEMAAWRSDERIGYLRVSYIPKAHIPLYMPTVLHYMTAVKGWCLSHLFDEQTGLARPFDAFTQEEIDRVCVVTCSYLRIQEQTWPTMKAMTKALRGPLQQAGAVAYQRFQKAVVDKPMVDYVRTDPSPITGVPNGSRGEGIGLVLYGAVAHHLHSLGFPLYASSNQSDDARRMWDFFRSQMWTTADGTRTVLRPHITNHPHRVLAHCPSTQTALT